MSNTSIRFTPLALMLALSLAACQDSSEINVIDSSCSSRAYAEIGGPFSLIDHKGFAVTQDDYTSNYSLVYFGFTYCPDVCPLSLVKIRQALDLLPESITKPQTLLISIDPERDTPELMKTYIENESFPDDLVGLTGSLDQVTAAANAFKAYFSKFEDDTSSADYSVDHSTITYLMDRNWQLKTYFTAQETPENMAHCLADLLK